MVRGTFESAEFSGQGGFGLIEVMIAVVITAIVSLQLASIFQLMGANANNLKGLTGAQSIRSSLLQLITLQTNCGNHLLPQYVAGGYFNLAKAQAAGLPLGFTGYDGSAMYGLDPVAPVGTPVPLTNYNVSVNYLVFEGANLVGPDGLGNNLYQGQLVASLSKMANPNQVASGGSGLLPVTVGALVLAVDGTNTIQYCYAQPMTASSACSALGGTYVAAAVPPCELPYPCAAGLIFEGYDTSVPPMPICNPSAALGVLTCPPGHGVISNGSGYICN